MRDGAREMVGGGRTGGTESVKSISWKCLECVSSSARGCVRELQVCGGNTAASVCRYVRRV